MTEPKFTPGPWFSNRQRVYWKKPDKDLPLGTLPNGQICTCKSAEDWPECDAEARANARLIATAPEMYDALYSVCVACKMRDHETECKLCTVEAALRKARGEEKSK